MTKGKSIGIISIKGGVGKTTTVLNLAHTLSKDFGKKVAVIDANFSSPNIGLYLGSVDHKFSLHHVLNDKSELHNAIYEHEFGFHFIPADNSNPEANKQKLKPLVNQLKNHYDVVLLDSSPTLNDEILATINSADELYVVSTPDIPTLTTTLKASKLARENKTKVSGLILNKVRGKDYELKPEAMEKLTGLPLTGVVKDSVRFSEALNQVKPITMLNPNSDVSLSYKMMAAKMVNATYEKPKWGNKLLGYLRDDFKNLTTHKFTKGLRYYK